MWRLSKIVSLLKIANSTVYDSANSIDGVVRDIWVQDGTSRKEYHARFANSLERAADKIKPELVLVSAGFDAHVRDPIGSLGLETEDSTTLTRLVLDIAKTHSKGRLMSCLEAGYNLDALAESVQCHLEELIAAKP
jgi:acetoin utilization deacetylase AcuC-like enzyme